MILQLFKKKQTYNVLFITEGACPIASSVITGFDSNTQWCFLFYCSLQHTPSFELEGVLGMNAVLLTDSVGIARLLVVGENMIFDWIMGDVLIFGWGVWICSSSSDELEFAKLYESAFYSFPFLSVAISSSENFWLLFPFVNRMTFVIPRSFIKNKEHFK